MTFPSRYVYELELEDADGTVYPLMFPDRLLQGVSGLGMPPIKHWATRAPYQTGQTHWGYAVQPRVINVVLYMKGCDRAGMYAKRRAMAAMLNPASGPHVLRLITPPPDPRKLELHDVYVTGGFGLASSDQPSPRVQGASGQLTAYDPIWKWVNCPLNAGETRDVNGRSCMFTDTFDDSEELVLPFTPPFLLGITVYTATLTCVNSGSWAVKPVITLAGPLADWSLTNSTTGKTMYWNHYRIDTGETVTLDIPNKTVTNNDGDSLLTYLSGDFGTFELEVGSNAIEFWAAGEVTANTSLQLCWYVEVLGA
jgi:hypothetical protein